MEFSNRIASLNRKNSVYIWWIGNYKRKEGLDYKKGRYHVKP